MSGFQTFTVTGFEEILGLHTGKGEGDLLLVQL
jgi:hypothetical protein